MRRRSLSAMDRPSEELSEKVPGPSIVLRPASPNLPLGGMVNAAGLKKRPQQSTEVPVASARPLPTAPVPPVSERLPRTRAVSGEPLDSAMVPCSVQSFSHHLGFLLDELQVVVRLNTWR